MRPRTIVIIAAIVSIFLLASLAQEVNRRWQVQREVARLSEEVREMEHQVVQLDNLNKYFATEDYQERVAREQLNYQAPGENVVLIPDPPEEVAVASSEVTEPQQPLSIPEKWWQVFFVDERPFESLNS